MTASSPESQVRSANDEVTSRVPRSLLVIIIILLAALYSYAAFIDKPAPEKTVEEFYQAYLTQDFDTVAQNLSVFWSVRLLPEYANQSPTELIEARSEIEPKISAILLAIEEGNTTPGSISVQVLPEYTQTGENSAIVAYSFIENGQVIGLETAILIKERGQFRIFTMSPINETVLDQIKDMDVNTLDESFATLLEPTV